MATATPPEPKKPRQPRRRSDAWLVRLLILSLVVNLIALLVIGFGSTGLIGTSQRVEGNAEQIEATRHALDQAERGLVKAGRALRQVCGVAGRAHRRAVRELRQTQRFLRTTDPASNPDLHDAIVRALPKTKAEVPATRPPRYCARQHATLPPPPRP